MEVKMKKIIVPIFLGLVLAGCAALNERRETLNDVMQAWVGSNESKLVARWGAPPLHIKIEMVQQC